MKDAEKTKEAMVQEIAGKLGVSPRTVHKHRQLIRRKLQLGNKNVNLSTYLRAR